MAALDDVVKLARGCGEAASDTDRRIVDARPMYSESRKVLN